jgi:hypothetical protein
LLAALVACSNPPPPVAPTQPTQAVAAPAPSGVQPEDTAGLYWVPYATCADCIAPQAIAAYITPDERVARAIRTALDGKLALGLPFVVSTDELGIAPRGIAVVIGAFGATESAGRAAIASPVVEGVHAQTFAIDPKAQPSEAPRHVTVVDRGGPVQAWSKADVDAAKAALDATTDPDAHKTLAAMHAWVLQWLASRPAACSVLPGELFVVEDDELDWYELAPVHCGGKLAYIDWTQSLLGHAVIVRKPGAQTLTQVVGAECDTPILRTWRYDAEGRHQDVTPPLQLAQGGC